jgi:uncharacterized protein (DUF2252 family)
MNDLKQKSEEQLIQMLANARKTQALCGGHCKAAQNENIAIDIQKELLRRGLNIPPLQYLYEIGEFNGNKIS